MKDYIARKTAGTCKLTIEKGPKILVEAAVLNTEGTEIVTPAKYRDGQNVLCLCVASFDSVTGKRSDTHHPINEVQVNREIDQLQARLTETQQHLADLTQLQEDIRAAEESAQ